MVLPFHCGNHSLRASAFLRQSQPPGFCLSVALAASRARAYLAAKTNQFLVTNTCPTQPSLIRVVYACLHAVCVRGMLMMYACLHAVCVRGMLTYIKGEVHRFFEYGPEERQFDIGSNGISLASIR